MRYRTYLRQRYRALLSYAGQVTVIVGLLHLAPLALLLFYPSEIDQAAGFLLASLPLIMGGGALWRRLRPKEALNLTVAEGSVIVVMVWIVALLAGAVPFMFGAGLNFTQAIFESTSGWTTTGLSVVDVSAASPLILFHRSFIQLAGGAGFAIIALSAVAGSFGMGFSAAEGRAEQLAPHVRRSATIVLTLYLTYTAFGVIGLRLAGMGWFDSFNHAFAAIAGGGFSTRPEGAAFYDRFSVELVLMALMLLGATNFFIAYTALRGKWRAALRSGEIRLMAVLLTIGIAAVFFIVTAPRIQDPVKALRVAAFESVSALTTTGFSTVYLRDFLLWSDFGWMALMLLMLIGGGTGSTAGGLKLIRVYILYKAVVWEVRKAFMPPHMVNEPAIWQGDRRELLSDKQVRQTAIFTGIYLTVFLLGGGIMVAAGYPMREGLFEFASALATTGLTGGVTNAAMPPGLLWLMSGAMLLGRLEFFALIVGLLKLLSDSRTILTRDQS